MPLHTRRRVIESVLNEILGLHNKRKAAVHSVHKMTGPKKKKKKKEEKKNKNNNNKKKVLPIGGSFVRISWVL